MSNTQIVNTAFMNKKFRKCQVATYGDLRSTAR